MKIIALMMMMMKLPILPFAEELELVLSTASDVHTGADFDAGVTGGSTTPRKIVILRETAKFPKNSVFCHHF